MQRKLARLFVVLIALFSMTVLYNLDAIIGRWKFEQLCKAEGGARFYEAVNMDVGWEVEEQDVYDYQWPFLFNHIDFVRYKDKSGKTWDVEVSDRSDFAQRKYIFKTVNENKSVRYRLRYSVTPQHEDERIVRIQRQVIDKKNWRVVASFTEFSYMWTKPERVILAMPTGIQCWAEQAQMDEFYRNIYRRRGK